MLPEIQAYKNLSYEFPNELLNSTIANERFRFGFETGFDYRVPHSWMKSNWTLAFYLVAAYLVSIFGVQHLMKTRARFELRGLLAIWSLLLAGFSIMGTVRMFPEMLDLLSEKEGFHKSVCSGIPGSSPMFEFWTCLFVLSKAPELGDTIFIVLRKQPLIFLHWYHHITVLLYCWYSYVQYISTSRWFVVMNFTVHGIMYSYYGLRALRVGIPKPIAATITSLQILQMIVGVVVNAYAFSTKVAGTECDVPFENIYWALAMYVSYFYLFVKFFQKSYGPKGKKGEQLSRNIKKD